MSVGDLYALKNAIEALKTDDEVSERDLAWAPIVDNWQPKLHTFPDHVVPGYFEVTVAGFVAGRAHVRDGAQVRTSAIAAWDADNRWIRTQNTLYRLGYRWHERALILRVAEQKDWGAAALFLIEQLGSHTLQWGGADGSAVGDFAALEAVNELRREAEEDVRRDYGLGRDAAKELGDALKQMGRLSAGRAVGPLTVRSTAIEDVANAWYDLKIAAGPVSSDETAALIHGWYRLSKSAYDAGDLSTTELVDAIAAAHVLTPKLKNESAASEPVGADDADGEGVVVLERIGGIGTERHQQARRIVSEMIGKRLPLAPPPDVEVARAALLAEFPHLAPAIAMLLGDLRADRPPLFRPTLLVGPVGAGKTRFVRRLAETVGLPFVSVAAGSAWDGMIAGTSKGWSSGHPALPAEALLSRRRADVLILLDELEKAGGSDHNGSLENALLNLLERETARAYPDKFFDAPVDLSHVSWIATANSTERMSEPLRDRLRVVRVDEPGVEHLIPLARSIVGEIARGSGDDVRFTPPLDAGELSTVEKFWRGGSVRRLRKIVEAVVRTRETNPRN